MGERFYSKVDTWLIALLATVMAGIGGIMGIEAGWESLLIIIPLCLVLLASIFPCHYTVVGKELYIKDGAFHHLIIPVSKIIHLSLTTDPLSAPALSLKRIEIRMNDGRRVLVSPKDREAFIRLLVRLNPNIECLK
ncbi:MAG: PH domain-containing protein [Prevotella sp.]|nr:PH domain-containing protein [Prevotella sp.]